MPRDNRRSERVAAAIREEVASYIATGAATPEGSGIVTVTGVDVTPDLRRAKVFVSVLGGDEKITLAALTSAGFRLRGDIGRALRLRLAPELHFQLDDTAARASRIESLLAGIKRDERAAQPDTGADGGSDG